ncbi:MAG TPA: hypothetical protein DCR40_10190 [Prolixibacteraceae bacterium]|nr:hypothetical protein [Prolixibacteraceae bacterium]
MQKETDSFLEKCNKYLFDDQSELPVHFDADEQNMIIRLRDAYVHWLAHPEKNDSEMINYITETYDVSQSTAYRDLPRVKILIGNVKSVSREFHRHTANHMIREGYKMAVDAESLLEVKQAEAMIRAGQALVKVNKLDKDESEALPWEDIVPLDLEPSTDVSVIGRKPIANLKEIQAKLRKKYGVQVEEVSYTEVSNGEESE